MAYFGEKKLGNFRPSLQERTKKHVSAQQRREGNSAVHKHAICCLPCCICGAQPPVDPHHLKTGPAKAERGVGMKATDRWLTPLCRICHSAIERAGSTREFEFFASYGIDDPYGLADALWNAPKNYEAMIAILAAHCKIKVRI